MTLFGKSIFADVNKDLEMSSSWMIWVGHNPVTSVHVRDRRREDMGREEEKAM